MLAYLKFVAEAIVENGVSGLASMVPGGSFAVDVARSAWLKMRQQRKDEEIRADLQALAQASFEDVRKAASDAAVYATGELRPPIELELYLSQIPAAVKQSLKRPEDPAGSTVPSAFAMTTPDAVLAMLPARPPRFRYGDPFPGRPGWILEKPLGVGGFGEVWLARNMEMTSVCGAVKFCHGEQARELKREGEIINQVMQAGEHPNIVRLKDAQLTGENPWLMFEYVPGGDLADWIRAIRRLSPDQRITQVVAALRQLAGAVGHFHRMAPAVVHRDLKPANILTDKVKRRLRITDFGIGGVIAQATLNAEDRGTMTQGGRTHSFLRGSHTPLYASPQQKKGAPPDPRDDVHALGVIGYQLVTGHLDQGAGPDFADDLRENGAPEALITLLGKCVAQSPDRRPRNGAELAEALGLIRTAPAATPAPPIPPVASTPAVVWPTPQNPPTRPTVVLPPPAVSVPPARVPTPIAGVGSVTPTAPAPIPEAQQPTAAPKVDVASPPPAGSPRIESRLEDVYAFSPVDNPQSRRANPQLQPPAGPGVEGMKSDSTGTGPGRPTAPPFSPPVAALAPTPSNSTAPTSARNRPGPAAAPPDPLPEQLTVEEAIERLESGGGQRGATATAGHKIYESVGRLRFVPCQCGWNDADYNSHEYIARNSRGNCYYISHNLQTNKITIGTDGYHSIYHHSEVPECVPGNADNGSKQMRKSPEPRNSGETQPVRRRRLEVEDIGDVAVVNFVDKKILNEQNVQMIGDDLFRLVDELGRRKILLNFSNVDFISSAGLGKLITLHRKLQGMQGKLVLCKLARDILDVFKMTKLDRTLTIAPDEQSGLQSF